MAWLQGGGEFASAGEHCKWKKIGVTQRLRERLKVKLKAIFEDLFHLERGEENGEGEEPKRASPT